MSSYDIIYYIANAINFEALKEHGGMNCEKADIYSGDYFGDNCLFLIIRST